MIYWQKETAQVGQHGELENSGWSVGQHGELENSGWSVGREVCIVPRSFIELFIIRIQSRLSSFNIPVLRSDA